MATSWKHHPQDFRHKPLNALVNNWPKMNLTNRDGMVLLTLWVKANYKTNVTMKVSQAKLAKHLKTQRSHLNESLLRLEKAGFLSRIRGGGGRTTTYVLKCPQERDTTSELCAFDGDSMCARNGAPFQSVSSDSFGEPSPSPPLFAPQGDTRP
jgi:DNA-binding MarR family transcriptional regulator